MACYRKILVAIDFSAKAAVVLDRAQEMADLHGAELVLLHVVEPVVLEPAYDTLPPFPVEIERELLDRARHELSSICAERGLDGAAARVEVGAPKAEILRVARESGTELIIVGSHGRHGVALLLGSTANGVLHGAFCDVLAVRIGAGETND